MSPTHPNFSIFTISISLLTTLILISNSGSSASDPNSYSRPTDLVNKVCKQTRSYSSCVHSLYSDSRTSEADEYTLAYVAVGLAYANASSTRSRISQLLRKNNGNYKQPLERCARNYKDAITLLGMADNDLNSETFFEISDLAGNASAAAYDCEAAFRGFRPPLPLGRRNKDLQGLCEICGVVAKLFTGLL
ncbi:uncharacterized protein LOC126676745 [Mercurialis annua]|uniref:uncharacterized protein LOC126676745 n=1 Tax=Mercurialis annua TaxID=3986 RepID=UPI00215E2AFC|nr:uncharacterized protein LOC126676745 [Mercurialis annua]